MQRMSPRLRQIPALLVVALLSACAVAPQTRVVSEPVIAPAPPPRPAAPPRPACADCGRVTRVEVVAGVRATTSGGAVLGGVVGGVVSAPKGSGAATVASASAPQRAWRVHLRMDDGRNLVVHQNLLSPSIVAGSRVRLVQGRLVPQH
jgi:uncharacterized protein YcfJ